ncbi:hypothetical protein [Tunturiibacter gelidoferens]|uniref:Uncharacterized protein n=1 Tax=Tunturiibacter lichenicola TaxID=2051959 RepID=A0A7Y9NLE5_9BACT|nr:hypothetical protein [Edaphobacter lichenicola]NYF51559.1 hypothetical protein [Edaphobacter lichenicola]
MTIFFGWKSGNGWSVWVGRFGRYRWVEGVEILHSVQDDGKKKLQIPSPFGFAQGQDDGEEQTAATQLKTAIGACVR